MYPGGRHGGCPHGRGDPREPITREQFYALVDSGSFADRRVELVGGRIVEKEPMGPQHGRAIRRIAAAYRQNLTAQGVDDRYEVMQQSGFAMPDGGVRLPDIAVVTAEDADRSDANPSFAFLIVEVARTSLEKDLAKAVQYAQVAQEYWVVDLVGEQTHVVEDRSAPPLTEELPRFYQNT